MNNRFGLTKILNIIGLILFIIAFASLCYENVKLLYVCLVFLISCLFMLPDSILFTIRKYKENERFGIYWISKFLGLIIAIIIFTVGVYHCGVNR
ncbi:MAG: hypothetical protein ACI4LX_09890 [Treponema sp.]